MNFFSRRNQILLKELIKTDFKLRYQGSAIGYLWSILKPVMLFLIMYLVFVRFMRFGEGTPHFAVALLLGITIWNFFGETTGIGMLSVVSRGDMLRKVNFSKSVIVFSVAVNAFINLMISLAVVTVFALINGVQMSWTVVFVAPLLLELILLLQGFPSYLLHFCLLQRFRSDLGSCHASWVLWYTYHLSNYPDFDKSSYRSKIPNVESDGTNYSRYALCANL